MKRRVTAPLAVLLSFTCGCYTTRQVTNTAPIAQPTTEDGLVVQAKDGHDFRVDPNTQFRFHRLDGTVTDWFRVSELVVSEEGVLRQNTTDGMLWSDISDIEAKNFSGGKTLGAIAISTAAVLIVVAMIAGAKGGGGGRGTVKPAGGGSGGLGGWHPNGTSGGGSGGGVSGGGGGGSNGGVGGIYINTSPGYCCYLSNGVQVANEKPLLGAAGFTVPDPSLARPMFEQETERKAKAQMVASIDASSAGDQFNPAAAPNVGVAGVVRLGNIVDIGGGYRQMFPTQLSGAEGLGFFRFGLHLNLDQRHLFAIPLSFDMGASLTGDALLYKINAGLELQLTQSTAIGIFPLNPNYLENNDGFGWGFPSSAELSFSF